MAVAFDAAANGTPISFATSITYSHTNAGDYIIVLPAWRNFNNITISSVTYAGDACTQVTGFRTVNSNANEMGVDAWRRIAPDTGANNVVTTQSGNLGCLHCGSASFSGVHQTVPEGTVVTSTGSGTAPSVALTCTADEIGVAALSTANQSAAAVTPGDTQIYETFNEDFDFNVGAAARQTGANPTINWTITSAQFSIAGVPILAAAGGGGGGGFIPNLAGQLTPVGESLIGRGGLVV